MRRETELLRAIERRAEGNPFFIEELLAARGESGAAPACPRRCGTCSCRAWRSCPRTPSESWAWPPWMGAPWNRGSWPRSRDDPRRTSRTPSASCSRHSSWSTIPTAAECIDSVTRSSPKRSTTTSSRRNGVACTPRTPRHLMPARYPMAPTGRACSPRLPITRRPPMNRSGPCGRGSRPRGQRPRRTRSPRASAPSSARSSSGMRFPRTIVRAAWTLVVLYHEASLSAMMGSRAERSWSWPGPRSPWSIPFGNPSNGRPRPSALRAHPGWRARPGTARGSSKPRRSPWSAPAHRRREPASSRPWPACTCWKPITRALFRRRRPRSSSRGRSNPDWTRRTR